MEKRGVVGAMLAVTVGMMFMAHPVFADDAATPQGANQAGVKCVGGNSCKGQSSCMSVNNSCKGQNACKGKGWITTSTAQECTQKGGHVEKE